MPGMNTQNVVTTILGVAVIAVVTADAFQITLGVRPRSRRSAPSTWFLGSTLLVVRRATQRFDDARTERWLSWFGPLSVLLLLIFWFFGQVLGFSLVWTSLPGAFSEPLSFDQALYFSGVTYLTIGFGDIVPLSDWARGIAIGQGLLGVMMVALVMGFLATLYGLYVERERALVMLDVPGVDEIRPTDLIGYIGRGPDGEARLRGFFADWSHWAGSLVTWHTTYPLLAFFRSQHPGQSWITGLGLLTDASTLVLAGDGDHFEAEQMYRRGSHAITDLFRHRSGEIGAPITRDEWVGVHRRAMAAGLDLGDLDESFDEVTRLRDPYAGRLEALKSAFAVPQGFWGSSSEPVPRDVHGRRRRSRK